MIEVEIKAAIADAEVIEKTLMALGFHNEATLREQDVYYNGNDRDFRKTDEAIRIRTCTHLDDGTGKNVLTYKGPKLGSESQTRQEHEVSFEEPDEMMAILSALGYATILEVKKNRRLYRLGDIAACIDHVDSLGDYLELEKLVNDESEYPEAVSALFAWLSRIGVPQSALTQCSYLELLLKQNL